MRLRLSYPIAGLYSQPRGDQERNFHRKKEYNQNKKEKETAWKPWGQSYQQGWRGSGYQGWRIMAEDMQANPIAATVGTRRSDEIV